MVLIYLMSFLEASALCCSHCDIDDCRGSYCDDNRIREICFIPSVFLDASVCTVSSVSWGVRVTMEVSSLSTFIPGVPTAFVQVIKPGSRLLLIQAASCR